MLKLDLAQANNLFPGKLSRVLSNLPSKNMSQCITAAGYSRAQGWRIKKQLAWLVDENAVKDGALIVNVYDKRLDNVFKYRYARRALRCLEEYGPLHVRYLSRLLRASQWRISKTIHALEHAGLVYFSHEMRGRRVIVRLRKEIMLTTKAPAQLVPPDMAHVMKMLTSSLQSRLSGQNIRCVILSGDGNVKIYVIPANIVPENLKTIEQSLTAIADQVMAAHGFWMSTFTIVNRAAWLRQLMRLTDFAPELEEPFDAPPIIGEKPHPDELYEALFVETQHPWSPLQVESWLKKKLLEPKQPSGYKFTVKGLKTTKIRGRLQLKHIKERVHLGQRSLQLILC